MTIPFLKLFSLRSQFLIIRSHQELGSYLTLCPDNQIAKQDH